MLFVFVVSGCGGGGYKDEDIGGYRVGGGHRQQSTKSGRGRNGGGDGNGKVTTTTKARTMRGGDGDSGDGGVPAQQATIS